MMHRSSIARRWLCATLLLSAAGAMAEAPAFNLRGVTHAGPSFDMAQQHDKVVVVYYWSSRCAVCLSQLAELRANADGWAGKPFVLVTVNTDAAPADWQTYEGLNQQLHRASQGRPSLWSGAQGYQDSLAQRPQRMPTVLVVAPKGRLAFRYEGRMPPELWNDVADLMP